MNIKILEFLEQALQNDMALIEKINKAPTEKINKAPTEKINKAPTEKINKAPTEKIVVKTKFLSDTHISAIYDAVTEAELLHDKCWVSVDDSVDYSNDLMLRSIIASLLWIRTKHHDN